MLRAFLTFDYCLSHWPYRYVPSCYQHRIHYQEISLNPQTGTGSQSLTVNREAIKSTPGAETADSEPGAELSVRAGTAVTGSRRQYGSEELQLKPPLMKLRTHESHRSLDCSGGHDVGHIKAISGAFQILPDLLPDCDSEGTIVVVKLILRLKAGTWIYSILLEHNCYLENSTCDGNFDRRS
jgi:hypothetical protein